MRFLLPLLVVGVAQTVWASSAENGATIEERRPLQEGSQGEGLALKKRAQRCALTSACTNTPPANANRYCDRGLCSFRCRTGYKTSADGASCVSTSSATTSTSSSTSALAPTTTRVAVVATPTCSVTSDCTNAIPVNANRYCNKGSCTFRCRTGFTLNARGGCSKPVTSTSTTVSSTTAQASSSASRSTSTSSQVPSSTSSAPRSTSSPPSSTSSAPSSTSQAPTSTSQAQSTTPAPSTSATTSSTTTSTTTTRPAATAPAATPTLKKTYQGSTFFDSFWFLNTTDPTNGMVSYVGPDYAREHGLINVTEAGTVIISIDRTSKLASGVHRDSVRISSYDTYNAGNLMIFDVKHVPVGCSVWPAIWTFNTPWPDLGEIDIYEGVNARSYNQMTLHSSQGCRRNPATPQTGNPYAPWASDDCYAYGWSSGCTVMDWDPTSYGTGFNAAGGGVWAVLFAETGISMWRWTRSAIPSDIKNGAPGWKQWGTPVAAWDGSTCDIRTYFQWQMITFDITTCGDWAGQQGVWQDQTQSGSCYPKYATCGAAMQDPANFAEAYFEINSVKVYGV